MQPIYKMPIGVKFNHEVEHWKSLPKIVANDSDCGVFAPSNRKFNSSRRMDLLFRISFVQLYGALVDSNPQPARFEHELRRARLRCPVPQRRGSVQRRQFPSSWLRSKLKRNPPTELIQLENGAIGTRGSEQKNSPLNDSKASGQQRVGIF